MHYKPHKRRLTRFSYAALVAVLCPSISHAQLLPNQALTVDGANAVDVANLLVIDDSGAILSTVVAGISAIDVAVSPDGTTGLVTLFLPNQLLRFDLTTSPPTLNATLGVPLSAEDVDLACTPTGFALITGLGSFNVVSVDITTTPMTLVENLVLPFGAGAVEVTPDGSLAVVAGTFIDKVQFVSISGTGMLTVLGSLLPAGDGPINVGISPNGNIAIVPNFFDGTVSVYDLNTLSFVGSIDLAPGVDTGNQSVVFSPDGSKAYVYDVVEPLGFGTVSVLAIDAFDNVTDTFVRITGLGGAPSFLGVDQLAITRTGADLYVRSATGFEVVDTSTNTIKTALVPLPLSGGGVATLAAGGCPCDLLTTTDFEPPMGMSKKLNRTLPIKFRLFFDGVEITSEEQLNQVLEDNGCQPGCPELIVTLLDDDPMGLPMDNTPNVGDPDEGNCFRYSAPNWIYNLRLTPDEPAEFEKGCYLVEVLIGDCLVTPGNNIFDIR